MTLQLCLAVDCRVILDGFHLGCLLVEKISVYCNYTTVDPKQLHKSHMKFWRQAQSTDTPDQLENRMGQKTGLGDEPRRRTQHPRPDGRQAGRQDQRQEKDKPRGGRHSIPDERQATRQNKDKSWGDKTRDKRKTRPGRRTEHPRPDGRQAETRPARRTQHPRPDGRQGGRQDRRQA